MDRRIPFCGVAALICLLLSELAEDSFRGIALFFAGVYALYTLLFTLDDLSRRRAAAAADRRRQPRPGAPEAGGPRPS
jgi:hypothetical protein